jgi:hypothetical protein
MESTPLQNLAAEVSQALIFAGWKPGMIRKRPRPALSPLLKPLPWWQRKRGRLQRRLPEASLEEFPLASLILDELYGLKVTPIRQDLKHFGVNVKFDPLMVEGQEGEVAKLGDLLCVRLYPLGIVDNSIAILLIADTGHTLMLGIPSRGVILCGDSFGQGMYSILAGEPIRPIFFENDMDNAFLGPWETDHPLAVRIGKAGLKPES